jgi:hypothetical protein
MPCSILVLLWVILFPTLAPTREASADRRSSQTVAQTADLVACAQKETRLVSSGMLGAKTNDMLFGASFIFANTAARRTFGRKKSGIRPRAQRETGDSPGGAKTGTGTLCKLPKRPA